MSSDPQLSNPPEWDWPYWMKGSMPNPLDFLRRPEISCSPYCPDGSVA